jgi:hypothetical protein
MPDQPNLGFLSPHQLQAGFLACYDASSVRTPNIDRSHE